MIKSNYKIKTAVITVDEQEVVLRDIDRSTRITNVMGGEVLGEINLELYSILNTMDKSILIQLIQSLIQNYSHIRKFTEYLVMKIKKDIVVFDIKAEISNPMIVDIHKGFIRVDVTFNEDYFIKIIFGSYGKTERLIYSSTDEHYPIVNFEEDSDPIEKAVNIITTDIEIKKLCKYK